MNTTRRGFLKALGGAAAVAVLPALPASATPIQAAPKWRRVLFGLVENQTIYSANGFWLAPDAVVRNCVLLVSPDCETAIDAREWWAASAAGVFTNNVVMAGDADFAGWSRVTLEAA